MTHQTTTPVLSLMRQHIVLLQAMLQQYLFAALRNPVQELARSFAQRIRHYGNRPRRWRRYWPCWPCIRLMPTAGT